MRLNKFVATRTGISRREADEKIAKGEIKINGQIVSLGAQIGENDEVECDGKILSRDLKHTTILLNKPEGFVSSRAGQGRKTVYDLLPEKYKNLKTVGRLDQNSSGLLLLTSDGDFAHKLTHPKFAKIKIYEVKLDEKLEPLHQQMINDFGVNLDDGNSKLTLEKLDENRKVWRVIMSEGRNRQIRRTFKSLGYEVIKLHRTNFGEFALNDLKSGEYKEI